MTESAGGLLVILVELGVCRYVSCFAINTNEDVRDLLAPWKPCRWDAHGGGGMCVCVCVCGISVHFASFATTSEFKFVATSNSDSGHSLTHNTTRKVVRSEAELRQVLDRAYITRRGLGTQYTKGDDLHVVYEVCPLPACTQRARDTAHSCVPQLCVESQALEDLAGCLPGTADPAKLASGMIMVDGTAAMLAEASAEDTAADNPSLLARLRFVELSSSRQALAAVGAVMTALTRRRQASHVPYRDSKLTRLLAPAFGACLSA